MNTISRLPNEIVLNILDFCRPFQRLALRGKFPLSRDGLLHARAWHRIFKFSGHGWLEARSSRGCVAIIGKDVQHLYDGDVDRPIRLLLIFSGLEEIQKLCRHFQQSEFCGCDYNNGIHTIRGTGIQLMVAMVSYYIPVVKISRRQFQWLYAGLNSNTEYPTTSILYYSVMMPPVKISAYPLEGHVMSWVLEIAHIYRYICGPLTRKPLRITFTENPLDNDGFGVDPTDPKTVS